MSEAAAQEYQKAVERSSVLRYALSDGPFRLASLSDFKVLHMGFTIDENWVGEVTIINEGQPAELDVHFRVAHRSKPFVIGPCYTIDEILEGITAECPEDAPTLQDYKEVVSELFAER